jgi:hypothetical protein
VLLWLINPFKMKSITTEIWVIQEDP